MGRADLALFGSIIKRIKASKKQSFAKQELLLMIHETFVDHVEEGRRLAKLKYGTNGGLTNENVQQVEDLLPQDVRKEIRRPRGF